MDCSFWWCGHRDLNSDGVTIRPSNVRVCLFRHDRLTLLIIWLNGGYCQGVLHLNFAKRQHFFQTHILSLWASAEAVKTNETAISPLSFRRFPLTCFRKTFLRARLPMPYARAKARAKLPIRCNSCNFCVALWRRTCFEHFLIFHSWIASFNMLY